MIIYNVTIKTDKNITEEWLKWMQEEHLKEMMGTGLFTKYRLCQLLEEDEDSHGTFVIQYHCDTLEKYQEYLEKKAKAMREKGHLKFGNQFVGFRTIMEIIKEQNNEV